MEVRLNRPRYYRRDGKPYEGDGLLQWSKDLENKEMQRVTQTTLADGRWISTVWLGLDHQYGDGPPLIFETMVFSSRASYEDEDQERYSTEKEAVEGHERMVEKWRNKNETQEK